MPLINNGLVQKKALGVTSRGAISNGLMHPARLTRDGLEEIEAIMRFEIEEMESRLRAEIEASETRILAAISGTGGKKKKHLMTINLGHGDKES